MKNSNNQFDVFISHASEDKGKLVRQLAKSLEDENLTVWYDEHTLQPGDSLRKSIDNGLKKSKYGILILSPSFFGKQWPEWELNGLVQLQNTYNNKKIIPIWHNVDRENVLQYSPPLADIISIKSDLGIDYVVKEIIKVVRPIVPSLVYARSILQDLGYSPPPPNDEWWLDVIEYDGSDSNIYDWAFSVGYLPKDRAGRGKILAKKTVQRKWQEIVVEENISQITNPKHLIDIIESTPGVFDLLEEYIDYTICFAPQLTIKGFEGPFEQIIEEKYQEDLENYNDNNNSTNGSALSINGDSTSCSIEYSLRHPKFGFYKSSIIICQFVQGEMFGPSPNVFDHFEYLVWLLSKDSDWMPKTIKNLLIDGFLHWNVWPWFDVPQRRSFDNIQRSNVTGKLWRQMHETSEKGLSFKINDLSLSDIYERIGWSLNLLEIDDNIENIANKFIEGGFIEKHIEIGKNRKNRK